MGGKCSPHAPPRTRHFLDESGSPQPALLSPSSPGRPADIAAGGGITEIEWQQCCGTLLAAPPYPLALVGRVQSIVSPLHAVLQEVFLQRVRIAPPDTPPDSAPAGTRSRFRRKHVSAIPLRDYLLRICNYVVALEPVVLLAVLAYAHHLDPPPSWRPRLRGGAAQPPAEEYRSLLAIDPFSAHRFVIASVCLASKAIGDNYYSNAFYAKVGGVSVGELNVLELELATLLDWRLQCPLEDARRYWRLLERHQE